MNTGSGNGTWNNVGLSLVRSWGIYLGAISKDIYLSLIWVWKLLIQKYRHISQGPISSSLWCWTQNIPGGPDQNRGCWCTDSLTYWGRVTHICVSKLNIIGSDNGLQPGRRQAIIRTNAGILLIVLPIDIENPYRLSNCLYRYISIYIGFLATNF